VNWQEPIDGFELNENAMVDDNVEPIAAIDTKALVLYRQRALSFEGQSTQRKLGAETRLVGRLQKPRSQAAMHFDQRTDDWLGPVLKTPDLPISLFHIPNFGQHVSDVSVKIGAVGRFPCVEVLGACLAGATAAWFVGQNARFTEMT